MPNATQDKGETELPNDATPTAVATRQELARSNAKPPRPEPGEPNDEPYDNIPCTD